MKIKHFWNFGVGWRSNGPEAGAKPRIYEDKTLLKFWRGLKKQRTRSQAPNHGFMTTKHFWNFGEGWRSNGPEARRQTTDLWRQNTSEILERVVETTDQKPDAKPRIYDYKTLPKFWRGLKKQRTRSQAPNHGFMTIKHFWNFGEGWGSNGPEARRQITDLWR